MFKPSSMIIAKGLTQSTALRGPAFVRPVQTPFIRFALDASLRPLGATMPSRAFSMKSLTTTQPQHFDANEMPVDLVKQVHEEMAHRVPMRHEFLKNEPLSTSALENMDVGLGKHRAPSTISDTVAYQLVRTLRWFPDTYFKNNHYMRVVMLETVAAIPGMVAGMLRHMKSLRRIKHDGGWILHLLHEAENERMHLMTFMKILQPSWFDRLIVLGVQGVVFNAYFLAYLLSPRTAHRFVGYLEEEAVISYTHFLRDIDNGLIPNKAAPAIAREYWNLRDDATMRDVILAIRADESLHRDSNHHFADRIAAHQEDLREDVKKLVETPEWKQKLSESDRTDDLKWGGKQALN